MVIGMGTGDWGAVLWRDVDVGSRSTWDFDIHVYWWVIENHLREIDPQDWLMS